MYSSSLKAIAPRTISGRFSSSALGIQESLVVLQSMRRMVRSATGVGERMVRGGSKKKEKKEP